MIANSTAVIQNQKEIKIYIIFNKEDKQWEK